MLRTSPLLLSLSAVAVVALLAACGGGSAYEAGGGPLIASVEPASGGMAGGTTVVIRGASLANPLPGAYQILVGGQPAADIVVVDGTEVECTTPPGAQGAADVTIVTTQGEDTAPGGFTYHPPPTVASITPIEGTRDGAVPVTVTGTGFAANEPGDTVCLIGLKELGNLVVVDDTTITGLTPSSWTEVPKDVVVENRNGRATLRNGFTYVGPIPVITGVNPDFGQKVGGLLVTITGDHYTDAGGELFVRFGSAEASLVTRVDDQTLTCITPVSQVVGFVDVTVGNNNGESTLVDGFYYLPPPVATAITPDEGPIGGGTAVTISGQGFTLGGPITVRFAANYATSVVVVDDQTITCDTPGGASVGNVIVTVQNINGLGTVPGGFTYTAPPFWWENTLGTASSSVGDGVVNSVSLPNGFPYFGTTWSSIYVISDGHMDFGSYTTSYSTSNQLFTFPHISVMGQDMNTSTANNTYSTSHVAGRTIITYDHVPEYSTVGANSVQIHLLPSGTFAILYGSCTFHATTSWTATARVAANPGGSNGLNVDFSSGSFSGSSSQALTEQFASTTDLAMSYIVFTPNSGGGYDSQWFDGLPTDPDP